MLYLIKAFLSPFLVALAGSFVLAAAIAIAIAVTVFGFGWVIAGFMASET